jgi:ribose transport system ATP-binding protein
VPPLRLAGLTKRFGPTVALDGASFEVEAGEIHALVGENGAGKSTLLGIVSGNVKPDAGEMFVSGEPYRPRSPADARRAGVALVHQELSLFPHLTVAENILLPAETHRWGVLDRRANRSRARDVLVHLGHPEIDADVRLDRLSIAARQVVEICRAVAADARILLLDEPTSSLPREDVERLFAVVRRLASSGVAVVYISHALEEVRELASRATVLRDGRDVATRPVAGFAESEMIASMAGRRLDRFFPSRERRTSGEVALAVRGLSAPPGLVDASFDLHRGEIFGVAGLVGSGRSTLVKTLFGLVRARAGAPSHQPPSRRIASGIGYVSEDRRHEGLAIDMSIADNVTLTALGGWWVDRMQQAAQARGCLVPLATKAPDVSRSVRTLSGGNQQKVSLARLLNQRARVLLLDEPTRGIDVASKADVYRAIAALADAGCAVLVVSSSIPELFGLCDRIAVMRRGRLLAPRPVSEWTEHAVLEQALGSGGDSHNGAVA